MIRRTETFRAITVNDSPECVQQQAERIAASITGAELVSVYRSHVGRTRGGSTYWEYTVELQVPRRANGYVVEKTDARTWVLYGADDRQVGTAFRTMREAVEAARALPYCHYA